MHFYNNENNDNDNDNSDNDNNNNYANNHNICEMKFRNGKATEDPLYSKKEKKISKMVFSLPLFPFTDF